MHMKAITLFCQSLWEPHTVSRVLTQVPPHTHVVGRGGEKTFDQHTGTAVDANLRRSNL